MQIQDWLMICAVFFGPIIAVRITRHLDNQKEVRDRKLQVFKTLMATRAYTIAPMHVEALNRIDLEFNGKNKKEREVIEAWKEYLDLLRAKDLSSEQWNIKRIDLFVGLLHKMAKVLDYEFDKTHIKNSAYAPMAHSHIEEEQKAIRRGIIELLEGKRFVPMFITNLPSEDTHSPEQTKIEQVES